MDLKVLILDDEYIILDGLCSFPWESYGCCVVGSAGDGAEGLALAAKHHPDIILSDIKMPGMDGLEFSKQIKLEDPDTGRSDGSFHTARRVRRGGKLPDKRVGKENFRCRGEVIRGEEEDNRTSPL